MKKTSVIKFVLLTVFVLGILTACSKNVDVDLNNYVKFEYEGYTGKGTVDISIDYNKLLTEHEDTLGEKKSMAALRLLRKLEISADKTSNLSNGETINLSWADINKEELLNDAGLNVTYSDFTTTVSGLDELETIDLFKDIEIKTDGKDTNGYAWFYTSNLPSEYWFVDYVLEKSENLSNGEKIKITVKDYDGGDLDKKLAELGKVAASKEYYYTVTGLEELSAYDPFAGISVEFKGVSGKGTADIRKDSSQNDYIWSWDYVLDKTEELSNGDVVTVTVESGTSKTIEEYAASRGLKMDSTTMEFTVEGLAEPLTDVSMLEPELFEKIKSDDIDKIKAYWAKGEERSVEPDSLLNVIYIGSIITYQEGTSWQAEQNALYNIYKCDVKCSFDDQRWVYWYSLYDGITRNDDGSFNMPEAKCPSDDYTVSTYMISGEAFTTEDRTHFYLGYETYEKFRSNHIRYEKYVVFDNVDDTNEIHFEPALAFIYICDKNDNEFKSGNVNLDNKNVVKVYGDGIYTMKASLSEYENVPEMIDGLKDMSLQMVSENNGTISDIDLSEAEITDISIICDGNEIKMNSENIVTDHWDTGYAAKFYDENSDLTGKKAAVKSKDFSLKDTIEITFTVSGTKLRDNADKSTDNGINNDENVDTDNTENTDNTDNVNNTDNVDNTDNTGKIDDKVDSTGTDLDPQGNVNENGSDNGTDNNENGQDSQENGTDSGDTIVGDLGQYSVILVSLGEDRTRMIKLVNDYSHIGLMASRDLVDNVVNEPMVVIHTDEKDYADEIKAAFEGYGAVVEIRTNY